MERDFQFHSGLGKCLIPSSEKKQLKSAFFLSKSEPVSLVPPPSGSHPPSHPSGGISQPAPKCSWAPGAGRSQPTAVSAPTGLREQRGREVCVPGAGSHSPARLPGSSAELLGMGSPHWKRLCLLLLAGLTSSLLLYSHYRATMEAPTSQRIIAK